MYIPGEQDDDVKGFYQFVLFPPELILDWKMWRRMLTDDIYADCLRTLAVDKAHIVKKW